MCKLTQMLHKYVFYDIYVSWCAVRLLLLFKVRRDTKKAGERYPQSLEVHLRVDRLEGRRCFRGGVHRTLLVVCSKPGSLYQQNSTPVYRLHVVAKSLGNRNIRVRVISAQDCVLNKSVKCSERNH